MTLRRRAAAAAGLTAALTAASLVGAPVGPAGADPVITVTTPVEGGVVETATVAISGRVQTGSSLATLKQVTLTLGSSRHNVVCRESPCNFSWSPSITANGRYEVMVSATEQTLLVEGRPSTLTRRFVVDAPPARPVVDAPKVTDGRTVELSWTRNTEPDMLYYAVFRKDPGGTAFLPVGQVNHPTSGRTVAFTDATTTSNGGDYAYQVVAVRKGGAKAETASAPSTTMTATVPAPPTTTTAAPAPGAPGPGGTTTTTVKPGSAAGVDLSGFLASRARVAPTPPPTILEPPDTGFRGSLPFGAVPPAEELEEGEAEAVPPPDRRSSPIVSSETGRPLVPVAGGLILLLLAVHIRLLNRRLKPVAGGDLPIETSAAAARAPAPVEPVAASPEPVAVSPEPDPEPEPVAVSPEPDPEPEADPAPPTRFYDVAHDAGWDADWAPTDDASPDGAGDQEPDLDAEWEPVGPPSLHPDLDELDHIEVVDVIVPERRPLARSGSR